MPVPDLRDKRVSETAEDKPDNHPCQNVAGKMDIEIKPAKRDKGGEEHAGASYDSLLIVYRWRGRERRLGMPWRKRKVCWFIYQQLIRGIDFVRPRSRDQGLKDQIRDDQAEKQREKGGNPGLSGGLFDHKQQGYRDPNPAFITQKADFRHQRVQ